MEYNVRRNWLHRGRDDDVCCPSGNVTFWTLTVSSPYDSTLFQHYPKQPLKAVIIDTYLKVFRVILGEYTHGK